jgi:hypothetical protein
VRAYLRPNSAMSHITLGAWPADTATGARKFYAHQELVQAFRDQGRIEGWQLTPSFRFRFWDATQIVELGGDIDVDSYIAVCTNWDHSLRHLVARGIATDADRGRFRGHFAGFEFADARPGLELSRAWAIGDAEALDDSVNFIRAVRESFGVLGALCLT